ncbi:outer membrane lipid asymmetry maintenance protein MlaD [Acetobacteraceae bacterium]|nr:outer membrane lipid asymmetry maintenance protein MlaD [Acetobacteraceae bacterium]
MSFFPVTKTTQNFWEIVTGFLLILIAGLIAFTAFSSFHHRSLRHYSLSAVFPRVDGLEIGSDIRLAGVKVGTVQKIFIDPKTWQAHADFSLQKEILLPIDSNAIITSDSLLGGKYIALTPGAETKILQPHQVISDTQGTVSLEELISKFVFSAGEKDSAPPPSKHS